MTRNTWILIALLVVLIVATFVVLQRPGEQSTSGTDGDVLVSYDSAAVDRIEIVLPDEQVTLSRESGPWSLLSPLRAPANEQAVREAIGKGRSLVIRTIVSSNPAKQTLFQVDSTAPLVTLLGKGTRLASFRVGKTGPTYTETYVRREGSNEVCLTGGLIGAVFVRPSRDWRNKAILGLREDEIRSVRLQYGDTVVTVSRADTVWLVDGAAAPEYGMRAFIASLANLECDEFVDAPPATLPPRIGLIEASGVQLAFHQQPDDMMITVVNGRNGQMYRIATWRAGQVLKRAQDLQGG